MSSLVHTGARGRRSSRTLSRYPAMSKVDDLATWLSARMGDLMLTHKEAIGLVIKGVEHVHVPYLCGCGQGVFPA
jgi:hypothetical protein